LNSNNNNNNNTSITVRKNGNGIVAEMTVAAGTERVWRILTSFDEMDAHLSGLESIKKRRQLPPGRTKGESGNFPLIVFFSSGHGRCRR
jgi:carbon monoxide dehydrogenase subunit G